MTSLYEIRRAARKWARRARDAWLGGESASFRARTALMPLMRDGKTYNTAHEDYDPRLVRNYPGHIFNGDLQNDNELYAAIKKLAIGNKVWNWSWGSVLKKAMAEARLALS